MRRTNAGFEDCASKPAFVCGIDRVCQKIVRSLHPISKDHKRSAVRKHGGSPRKKAAPTQMPPLKMERTHPDTSRFFLLT